MMSEPGPSAKARHASDGGGEGWRSSLWRARASSYRCCARARLVITMLHKHAPCDAGQLVSQSCSQRIIVQPLSRSGKPRSKAVLHPIPWPKQNDTGRLQEEHTKVAIAAFGDAPGNRSITCGYLLGYQAEPSSKIAATCEGSPIIDRGTTALEMIGYMPGIVIKCRQGSVFFGERIDFVSHSLDAIVEAAPVLSQIL
jgi:hypothetical protein